jgi:hypothetical protein
VLLFDKGGVVMTAGILNTPSSATIIPFVGGGNAMAAKRLASSGLAVFPAIVCWNGAAKKLDKKPAIKSWQEAASTEAKQADIWWQQYPNAVPAIELGRAGLVVIDLDRHLGADDGVTAFKTLRGDKALPLFPVVRTAGNGFHLIFRQPEGEPLGNSRGNLPAGIDVRGRGGWIVAPGAIHERWAWREVAGKPPLAVAYRNGEIPPLSDWLLAVIRPQRARQYQPSRRVADDSWLRAIVRKVALAPVGERNALLFWAACRCGEAVCEGKVPRDWVSEVLIEAAARAGLSRPEANRTVQSGMRTGGAQ